MFIESFHLDFLHKSSRVNVFFKEFFRGEKERASLQLGVEQVVRGYLF